MFMIGLRIDGGQPAGRILPPTGVSDMAPSASLPGSSALQACLVERNTPLPRSAGWRKSGKKLDDAVIFSAQ
jgi:hypothetical protein